MGALQSMYKHFQAATMDFVQLMRINFPESMRCECDVPYRNLTWDGTTISCQTHNLCIVQPWGAPEDESVLTYGSTFSDRLLISDLHVRRQLRVFSREPPARGPLPEGVGLIEGDRECLEAGLTRSGLACVATVVSAAAHNAGESEDVQTCQAWARPLLQALSSDAPACTLVRPAAKEILQHFVAHRSWASAAAAAQAASSLPLLWAICKRIEIDPSTPEAEGSEDASLVDAVVTLLQKIQEVRPCCVQPCMPQELQCLCRMILVSLI